MHWLSELFKHITISRSLTAALFITTAVLLFGHHFYPTLVETVPPGWSWALTATFVFSGTLLCIWVLVPLWQLLRSALRALAHHPWISPPSQGEERLLELLSAVRDQSMNLEVLAENNDHLSMAELLEWSDHLRDKGLVTANPYSHSLITLTPRGRKYVLGKRNKS